MSRSLKKGPYVDPKLLRKIQNLKAGAKTIIKTWSRDCTIIPEMVGYSFGVHNGKNFIEVFVTEEKVGFRLGDFAPSRKFVRHGGRMAREEAQAEAQAEKEKIAVAQEPEEKGPKTVQKK